MRHQLLVCIGSGVLLLASTACNGSPPPAPTQPLAPVAEQAPAPTALPATAARPTTAPAVVPTAVPTLVPTAVPTLVVATQKAPDVSGAGDIRKIAAAMVASTSYRVQGTFTNDDGGVTEMSWEFVKPDKAHVTVKEKSGKTIEMTTIATDVYLNMGGKWTKHTTEASSAMGQGFGLNSLNVDDMVDGFNESVRNGDKYSSGGLDVVDGTPCQEFTLTPSNAKRPSGAWCVGLVDNLPRRFVANHSEGTGSMTMLFSSWNQPLKIEAPTL